MKGIPVESGTSRGQVLLRLLRKALDDGTVEYVLTPSRGPENSFPWILVSDSGSLEDAEPLPPVMSVQGARALSSVTRSPVEGRILAVMRPCEARASIETAKLQQSDLGNVFILTMDCPGAVPISLYGKDGVMEPDPGIPGSIRPLCGQCTDFTAAGDMCLVRSGDSDFIVTLTGKGRSLAGMMGLEGEEDIEEWANWRDGLRQERESEAEESGKRISEESHGLSGLASMFSGCVGCRSCRTVCPICHCRLCFIDMKDRRSPAAVNLHRSFSAGASRQVPDTLLFHIGRMAHMSHSCVSCGMCEDACPADIPVGRLVSMVGRATAALFDYRAGCDPDEPLPMSTFLTEELHEYED